MPIFAPKTNNITPKSRKGNNDMKTINSENIWYAVATFNADPYCVEEEVMVQEIMDEIEANGCNMVTDTEERVIALAKLDLPEDSERIVYRAGDCLFSMDGDEYTYDVVFDTATRSDNEGYHLDRQAALDYVEMNNGWSQADGYFKSYKGGTVRVICNETEDTIFEDTVK